MQSLYPPKLRKWDEIRVIAPARNMNLLSDDTIKRAISRLNKEWFKITFWKNVYETDIFMSSPVEARIEDLHDAFKDKKVKAIFSVVWWYSSNQMLKYIDYDLIRNNPKILCWFSDITTLTVAIYAKTWLVWYSWPHFSSWWIKYGFEYSIDYFKKCCVYSNPYDIMPSDKRSDDEWYLDQENREFIPNDGYKVVNNWYAKWKIIWWHLPCLVSLLWTEYFPNIDEDIILFLEQDEEFTPQIFDRHLQQLIHTKYFKYVKWIVIWRFQKKTNMTDNKLLYILQTKKELKNIPIIYNVNFWHTMPFITFPVWGVCELTLQPDEYFIRILEH